MSVPAPPVEEFSYPPTHPVFLPLPLPPPTIIPPFIPPPPPCDDDDDDDHCDPPTEPPTEVSEPGTLLLLIMGAGFIWWRASKLKLQRVKVKD